MIQDKVVIITGASSGIGEASAKLLASQGPRSFWALGARSTSNVLQMKSRKAVVTPSGKRWT